MRVFAQKQNRTERPVASSPIRRKVKTSGPSDLQHPLHFLQRTVGNQAVLRILGAAPLVQSVGGATAPTVARSPQKSGGGATGANSAFAGMRLGWNLHSTKVDVAGVPTEVIPPGAHKEEVLVKREVGESQGYDHRLQAIAVARLTGVENAAVVLTSEGKWHALETTATISANFTAANTPLRSVYGLPSVKAIAAYRQHLEELDKRLQELESIKGSPSAPEGIQNEIDSLNEQRRNTNKTLNAIILGVEESEIEYIRRYEDKKPGKVNVNIGPAATKQGDYDPGQHGPVGPPGQARFGPATPSAFEISHKTLADPAKAAVTLFHETTHLADYELARHWAQKYESETGRTFVSEYQRPFIVWILNQVKARRLSAAEAELVTDVTTGNKGATEARANIGGFLAAIQAGAADVAIQDLVRYAVALKNGDNYVNPGPHVLAAVINHMRTVYQRLPAAMQRKFVEAIEAAKKVYPNVWFSRLDFLK